jgi:hypothetical protein
MAGSAVAESLPDRRCHPGQELALQHSAGSGPDLVHLGLIFTEAGHVASLATLDNIVDRKLCPIVFDIRISHHFTPLKNGIDTGKPFA